jgi:hypothetical protein
VGEALVWKMCAGYSRDYPGVCVKPLGLVGLCKTPKEYG